MHWNVQSHTDISFMVSLANSDDNSSQTNIFSVNRSTSTLLQVIHKNIILIFQIKKNYIDIIIFLRFIWRDKEIRKAESTIPGPWRKSSYVVQCQKLTCFNQSCSQNTKINLLRGVNDLHCLKKDGCDSAEREELTQCLFEDNA